MAETVEIPLDSKKATKEVENLTEAVEKSTKESEKHTDTLVDNAKEMRFMGVSVNSLTKGFKGSVSAIRASIKGLKVFKIALAATGIGLIVVALGSLFAVLKKTQGGMNFMTKATNALKAIFDTVITTAIKMGKGIASTFSGIGKLIKGFLKQDVIAMAKGWEEIKNGADEMTKSVTEFGGELANNIEVTNAMSDAMALLEEHQIENISLDAARRAEMKLFNKQSEDINKTIEERIIASDKAVAVEKLRFKATNALAIEELRIAKQTFKISFQLNEDKRTLAELDKKISNEREEALERLTTQENRSNLLKQQQHNEELARIAAEELAKEKAALADIKRDQDEVNRRRRVQEQMKVIANKKADEAIAAEQREEDFKKKAAEMDLELKKESNEILLGFARDTFNAIGNAVERGSVAAKAVAIGQIVMNAAVAVIKMWQQLGVLAPLSIPIIGVAAFAATKAIKNIAIPPAPKFATGGLVDGPSHDEGGVDFGGFELEGGEAVINKRSTAMFRPLLSRMNRAGGGVAFQDGGIIRGLDFESTKPALILQPVLVLDDFHDVETRVRTIEERAEL